MAQPIIEVRGLSAGYDGRTVLHDVNLTVYERDFLGIIGPNGGGKTTLIRCMLGLLKPTAGKSLTMEQTTHNSRHSTPSFLWVICLNTTQ